MSSWESAKGASDEWCTPKFVFDALGCRFDLDVAAPIGGPLHVPAHRWLVSDSLTARWDGFVWMNPPFGGRNDKSPWLDKFFAHGNGIALTPDRTSAPWFQDAWPKADAVLFTRGKISFIRPDGSIGRQPGNGTALFAVGARGVEALERAESTGFGILAMPHRASLAVELAARSTSSPHGSPRAASSPSGRSSTSGATASARRQTARSRQAAKSGAWSDPIMGSANNGYSATCRSQVQQDNQTAVA